MLARGRTSPAGDRLEVSGGKRLPHGGPRLGRGLLLLPESVWEACLGQCQRLLLTQLVDTCGLRRGRQREVTVPWTQLLGDAVGSGETCADPGLDCLLGTLPTQPMAASSSGLCSHALTPACPRPVATLPPYLMLVSFFRKTVPLLTCLCSRHLPPASPALCPCTSWLHALTIASPTPWPEAQITQASVASGG